MRKLYFVAFIILLVPAACKKWDKPEKVASYIYIERIDLAVTPTQGTARHGIEDAWVYVNDQPVGVFSLPCLVPVLAEGKQKITIAAGIRDNGQVESRNKYAFYQFFNTYNIDLKPGQVDTLNGVDQPVVTYYSTPDDIEIWNENFDDAAVDFISDPNSEAGITHVPDPAAAFEGNGMGKIELGASYTYARVLTAQTFVLPRNGKSVYVELHYNSNNTMAIGIQTINGTELGQIENTIIRPSDGVWKKMYINLRDVTSEQVNADQFRFTITVGKDQGVTTAINYIDNFKVVYDK